MSNGFFMLPASEGRCQLCGQEHTATWPHDGSSLMYQMRFKALHGRDGTWADAVAHCSPSIKAAWTKAIKEQGVWTEPPEGVELIPEVDETHGVPKIIDLNIKPIIGEIDPVSSEEEE